MFIFVAMKDLEVKRKEFEQAVKPLLEYLNNNWHPHVTVVVTPTGAELLSGEMSVEDTSFTRD